MIRGYAAFFDVLTRPGNRAEPLIVQRNAFDLFGASIHFHFQHRDRAYASTRDGSLRVWQDSRGLAFEADPDSSHATLALLPRIADGTFSECSVGYGRERASEIVRLDGEEVEVISRARINEISVAVEGGCPGTACWMAGGDVADLPPRARALASYWAVGRNAAILAGQRYPLSSRRDFA